MVALRTMKTVLIFVMAGALMGVITASLVVPPALSWYTAPGGLPKGAQIQAVVEIPEVIRYATSRLIRGQAIGAGCGAALGLLLGIFTVRRNTIVASSKTSSRIPA